MTEIELRHSRMDIGIRAVGASLPFVCAGLLGYLLVRAGTFAAPAVAFIVLLLGIGAWCVDRMRRYVAEVVRIGDEGITFGRSEVAVPWAEIQVIESVPGKDLLSVRGADDTVLGTIPFGLSLLPEGVRAILQHLGPRPPPSETTGRAVEGRRTIWAYLPIAVLAFMPELNKNMERGVRGVSLLWSGAILAALGYGFYRSGGRRRLEITPMGLSWSTRRGEKSYHWAEIGLIGLHFRAEASHG